MKPKYLYRTPDHSIFYRLENGKYSHNRNLKHDWIGNEYSYELLMSYDCFFPCTEDDFDDLKEKSDLYYGYISWSHRNDGHGGTKGGTMEEYLQYLERVKRWELKVKEKEQLKRNRLFLDQK